MTKTDKIKRVLRELGLDKKNLVSTKELETAAKTARVQVIDVMCVMRYGRVL